MGHNRRRPWSPPDEQRLYAVLVESQRVNGQPRQRVVRYLGAIREGDISKPLIADGFWSCVDDALTELGLDDGQRQAITARIAVTVPRPDLADVERTQREFGTWRAGVVSMAEGLGRRRRSAQRSIRA